MPKTAPVTETTEQAERIVPALLSKPDLASYLGVSIRTIDRMLSTDAIPPGFTVPGISIERRWRRSTIDALIARWAAEGAK